jgi:hypothetical protein
MLLSRWLRLGAVAIAGIQALFGAAMTAAATLGAIVGVGFEWSMCTGGASCDSPGVLLTKATLLVALVLVTLVVAPVVVAVGLLRNRCWAPYAGVVIELILAAVTGIWLAIQQPPLPVTDVVGIPLAAAIAALLIAAHLVLRRVSKGMA